jgi:hypothetical protein
MTLRSVVADPTINNKSKLKIKIISCEHYYKCIIITGRLCHVDYVSVKRTTDFFGSKRELGDLLPSQKPASPSSSVDHMSSTFVSLPLIIVDKTVGTLFTDAFVVGY